MSIQRKRGIRYVECDGGDCEAVVPLLPDERGAPDGWYTRPAVDGIRPRDQHYCPACMDRLVEAVRRA